MRYKGIIHCHSHYSYDSLLKPAEIIKICREYSLNFILLTDHDSIAGSFDFRAYAQKQNVDIEVPLAAEYNTDDGEIIAAFIQKEIVEKSSEAVIENIRRQNGICILPHPFKGHNEPKKLIEKVDAVEGFNGRTSFLLDQQACEFASEFKKPILYGADAHLSSEYRNGIISFKGSDCFRHSLLFPQNLRHTMRKTGNINLIISQLIKAYKTRNLKLAVYQILYTMKLACMFRLLHSV